MHLISEKDFNFGIEERLAFSAKSRYNEYDTNFERTFEMKKEDFYFDLPEELIAQTPLKQRDASRLLVLDRESGRVEHKHFYDIIDYLNPGDVLVVHSSLKSMGHVEGGAECVIAALTDAIGPEGTLILPAFTFASSYSTSFFSDRPFNSCR